MEHIRGHTFFITVIDYVMLPSDGKTLEVISSI